MFSLGRATAECLLRSCSEDLFSSLDKSKLPGAFFSSDHFLSLLFFLVGSLARNKSVDWLLLDLAQEIQSRIACNRSVAYKSLLFKS
jgi:hypothetical protein